MVWGIMAEAGKPNLSDKFPVLKKLDLQGIRRRMTKHFGKMLDVFDCLIDQRMKLRQEHGSTEYKDILDTLLNIMDDKSVEIDRNYIKHLFIVIFLLYNSFFLFFFILQVMYSINFSLAAISNRICLRRVLIQLRAHWNGQ